MGGRKANHVRQAIRKVGGVRSWQLVLILIPLMFVTATLLRLDHLRMAEMRRAVIEADAAENETALQEKLAALRKFVFSHTVVNVVESNGRQMIVLGTGVFYLEHQYLRAANAAIAAAEASLVDDANPNGNIYAAVSAICRPLAIANGWQWSDPAHVECWTSELAKYPATEELSSNLLVADVPSTELFRISYASPLWSLSWAGLAILACAIIIIIVAIRFLIWCVLKVALAFVKNA